MTKKPYMSEEMALLKRNHAEQGAQTLSGLRALMSEYKLTRADVALLLGLTVRARSHGTVDGWLSGRARMPAMKLRLIKLELEAFLKLSEL